VHRATALMYANVLTKKLNSMEKLIHRSPCWMGGDSRDTQTVIVCGTHLLQDSKEYFQLQLLCLLSTNMS
jgi:hypothetical protein